MKYVPPFDQLKSLLTLTTFRNGLTATAPYDNIQKLITMLLVCIDVDEPWYLARNPDIAAAIDAGTMTSARDHFVNNGYFEGRLPFPIVVDETWYLQRYPEVAEAITQGTMESAQRHFDEHGYREGRKPFRV